MNQHNKEIMEKIKKTVKIIKINNQISKLEEELLKQSFTSNGSLRRETEKSYIIRTTMNELIDDKAALKAS